MHQGSFDRMEKGCFGACLVLLVNYRADLIVYRALFMKDKTKRDYPWSVYRQSHTVTHRCTLQHIALHCDTPKLKTFSATLFPQ